MSFLSFLHIELLKSRRSHILPLLLIAPVLVVLSGVNHLSAYFTPEYENAWAAMFIQSALLYAYYLLPLSLLVVCVMLSTQETQHGGLTKMLALPLRRSALALCKFCVLLTYLALELLVFLIVFILSGLLATTSAGIKEALPVCYVFSWCAKLFFAQLPGAALMWALTTLLENPLASVGLNLLFILPGVLIANTPLFPAYPYCYGGYLVSCSLHDFTSGGVSASSALFSLLFCGAVIFAAALVLTLWRYGTKEAR